MSSNQDIHTFAVKWFDLFRNTKTTVHEVENSSFSDECFALGFQADCGVAFEKAYSSGEALNNDKELDKTIEDITDIALLGSAIFSQWHYFTHRAGSGKDLLSFENRSWFMTALGRLERLTSDVDESALIFSGTVKKLRIVSNYICYGPCPQQDDEVEQHLSITANGRVFFSSYTYGNGDKYIKSRSKNFKIDASKAAYILNMAGSYFSDEYDASFVTDVGDWKMSLTNNENAVYHFRGSLCSDCADELNHISNIIRFTLDMPELLVFDGRSKADRIERISVDYHRVTKIKPGVRLEGATWESAIWDYGEQLFIDRKTETLGHILNIGNGCQVSRKYHVEHGITSLLDDLNAQTFFAHTEGNPPDVICNPLETKSYRITIDYLYGDQRMLTGSFDQKGLPDDFSDFAEAVFDFMQFYGMGEILDPSVHNQALRKQSDLIFCNVQFDEYGKTYSYLTDDDTLEVEDYVVVPVGNDNHESVAKIESIEYHPAEEAPFPIDRIKKIIRKVDKTEDSNDSIVLPKGMVVMGSEPLSGINKR